MKVFISQPMHGRTDEEILKEREEVVEWIKHVTTESMEIISTLKQSQVPDGVKNKRIWYLGHSIIKLAEADLVIFVNDWEKANGCQIEYEVAKKYKIPFIQYFS